ncbi:MAG: hypothetical protein ACJ0GH_01850 [Alphaproteobacteria bacterium]|tara:strand:- start:331 stop:498 length:168 start_codon:yes stop_codon:yes gene_type:complete
MLKSSDLQSLKSNFEVKSYKKAEVIFPQVQIAEPIAKPSLEKYRKNDPDFSQYEA